MKTKNLKEILCNTEIEGKQKIIDSVIKKITYDSRKIEPDSLFVAIQGFSTDGHNYLEEAAKKGATAAIVEKKCYNIDIPQYIVQNSRKELAQIAYNFY